MTQKINFQFEFQNYLNTFECYLKDSVPSLYPNVQELEKSIKYSLLAPGKRIRPLLLLLTLECFGKDWKEGFPFAVAIEYIHTYSLIHDDLPCMDNDDLRRGQPTNHIVFGEDVALLTGDGLLTYAFEKITQHALEADIASKIVIKIINLLAHYAGIHGMVAGQFADMHYNQFNEDLKTQLNFIHYHKTALMLKSSIAIGALLAEVSTTDYQHLEKFAEAIGIGFQIQDDILDATATEEQLGKPINSDQRNQKLTYPSVFGLEFSKKHPKKYFSIALAELQKISGQTDQLEKITHYLFQRSF